jgi:hypothetical protein
MDVTYYAEPVGTGYLVTARILERPLSAPASRLIPTWAWDAAPDRMRLITIVCDNLTRMLGLLNPEFATSVKEQLLSRRWRHPD